MTAIDSSYRNEQGAGRQGRGVVSAFLATAFAQEDADAAKAQWRQVADQLRPKVAKVAGLVDEVEPDPGLHELPAHRPKLHSTNPIERLNGEISVARTSSASSRTNRASPASLARDPARAE